MAAAAGQRRLGTIALEPAIATMLKGTDMGTRLDRLKAVTRITAEGADFDVLRRFAPMDCRVTPGLVLQLARNREAADLVEEAMVWGRSRHGVTSRVADRLTMNIAVQAARLVPGRICVEVDADLAFDPQGMAERALAMVAEFEASGLERERILVGIPATWEGITAAEMLRSDAIGFDLTEVHCLAQAAAAGEAGARIVSLRLNAAPQGPSEMGGDHASAADLVHRVARYFDQHAMGTSVNAGSFEHLDEIERVASFAHLSLDPHWLDALARDDGPAPLQDVTAAGRERVPARMTLDEKSFRFVLNEDGTAAERLAGGVRQAVRQLRALRDFASGRLESTLDPLAAPLWQDIG